MPLIEPTVGETLLETNHTQIVMWVVGTGLGVIVLFVTVLLTVLNKKVDVTMCSKIHSMMDEKLDEFSRSLQVTYQNMAQMLEKVHGMEVSLEKVRVLIENQVKTEASRWDRSEQGRKG